MQMSYTKKKSSFLTNIVVEKPKIEPEPDPEDNGVKLAIEGEVIYIFIKFATE